MRSSDRAPWPTRDEVALGAFLHDVGKFYQRACSSREAMPEQVRTRESDVLPSIQGRSTHWHALWTDAFFDELVDRNSLPQQIDSHWVRDCAVYHHKPLQDGAAVPNGSVTWLVAEADRLASGMERKAKDTGQDDEPTGLGRDAYRKTLLTSIFANLAIKEGVGPPGNLRQPLAELAAERLNPVSRDTNIDSALPESYATLWSRFVDEYRTLTSRVGNNVTAMHEGILSLSERFMWAIPSSTIDEPDVGLHDHARATAAVASCLHAHHEYAGNLADEGAIRDRGHKKLRFLVGDLSGIQTALFRLASEGAKGIARVLRGRSLRIQLIGEAAARLCLSTFGLPPYCVLQNAGGRFLILAPSTDGEQQTAELDRIRGKIDRWIRDQYQGDLVLNVAFTDPFAAADLLEPAHLRSVLLKIGQAAEEAKCRPLAKAREVVFSGEWDSNKGICSTCGLRPASETGREGLNRCVACHAETELGRASPKAAAIVMDHRGIPSPLDNILDFNIGLPAEPYPERPALGWRRRGEPYLQNLPVAERFATAYAPQHRADTINDQRLARARQDDDDDNEQPEEGHLLTFAELAALSTEHCAGQDKGRAMLAALKADVDRLGQVFSRGLGERRSLARIAALSRIMDAFFTGFLPHLLKERFPHVYTVYAGGDDLFLLGPWRDILNLAYDLREEFRRFVGGSPHVTLSAGIALFDPETPVSHAAHEAEARLSMAKDSGRDCIHAVLPADAPALSWEAYGAALRDAEEIHRLLNDGAGSVPTTLLHKLLWIDDRRRECEKGRTRSADWRAKLGYFLWRGLPRFPNGDDTRTDNDKTRAYLLGLMGLTPEISRAGVQSVVPAPARLALSIAIYRNR
jgi:CRISPR-associated protein Csm1